MSGKWTEEQKKAWSEHQKEAMNRPSVRRKIRDTRRKNREEGKTLTGIEQLASDEAYRAYQREYKRIYYSDPEKYEKWKAYSTLNKLAKHSVEYLVGLRDKHIRTGHPDKAAKVEEALRKKGDEYTEYVAAMKQKRIQEAWDAYVAAVNDAK